MSEIIVATHEQCRVGGGELHTVMDFGELCISDFLDPESGENTPAFPLCLTVAEKSGLIQLRHTVDPNRLYRNYHYVSGLNELMSRHLRDLARTLTSEMREQYGRIVAVDIGCNDGTLLSAYPRDFVTIGYDPSNIKPQKLDVFVNDFFNAATQPVAGQADIITSIAMFYDIENPVEFVRLIDETLKPHGVWVVEMHYAPRMIQQAGYDAICHEHLTYYGINTFEYVLREAGVDLVVSDVSYNDVNGGSFRLFVRRAKYADSDNLREMRLSNARTTEKRKLDNPATGLATFAERVRRNKDNTLELFHQYRREGKIILGYGASTKGSTMQQYLGLTPELMPAIADRNPLKWGKVTSGSRLYVISEERARAMKPAAFYPFPYHFMPQFMQREARYLQEGGKFIYPFPNPFIYNAEKK